jgi:hypothetical protein
MAFGFERASQVEGSVEQRESEQRLKLWIEKNYADSPAEEQAQVAQDYFKVDHQGRILVDEDLSFQGLDALPIPPRVVFSGDLDIRNAGFDKLPSDIRVNGNILLNGCKPSVIAQAEQLKQQGQIKGSLIFE